MFCIVVGLIVFLPGDAAKALSLGGVDVDLVTSGDGLYVDSYEDERYIYRGTNPNNYIEFNDELWRIVAKESDGTYKIIRNELYPQNKGYTTVAFDEANNRGVANNTYCVNSNNGCGVFSAISGTFQTPSGHYSGTVTEDSTIKEILNETYYNTLSDVAKIQLQSHVFNIGADEYLSQSKNDSITKNIASEKLYTWTGNIGLINVSDVLRASTNPSCTSATVMFESVLNNQTLCDENYLLEIPDMSAYWTINAAANESVEASAHAVAVGHGYGLKGMINYLASNSSEIGVRPVVFLKANITLSGSGTTDDPYVINDGVTEEISEETSTDIPTQIVNVPSTSKSEPFVILITGFALIIVAIITILSVTKVKKAKNNDNSK